ncbi:GATA zinc finger domain-containing protein 1 [Copidosoma floridanum]|uniref:GATA zinc finger domain-containing protein 1 n=1 Tax=Copidosoma floridanum TaxID=29053 RepID=UPI0006C95E5F|nr:GATA zinc finger domain-containing protein 1 [Copidosoma floridanum]
MPLGDKPECVQCSTKESPLWHGTDAGSLCNDCLEKSKFKAEDEEAAVVKTDPPEEATVSTTSATTTPATTTTTTATSMAANARKVTRAVTKCNGKPGRPPGSKNALKGKGRRHIFKKTPVKSPAATATSVTSNYVFYKGSYFQVGDIVSMQDTDGGIYYAQIRGLLTDQYCEKSAAITWLLPTTASPPPEEGFNPETYIIGPEEELPRKLEYMEFIMHAPSDYYKLKNTPYPPILQEGGNGYVWTTLTNESFQR